jgi:hypothetical protein
MLAMALANALAYYAIVLACGLVTVSKGHYRLAAVGVVLPFFWIIGAVKRAKPGSWWAAHLSRPSETIKEAGPDWTP